MLMVSVWLGLLRIFAVGKVLSLSTLIIVLTIILVIRRLWILKGIKPLDLGRGMGVAKKLSGWRNKPKSEVVRQQVTQVRERLQPASISIERGSTDTGNIKFMNLNLKLLQAILNATNYTNSLLYDIHLMMSEKHDAALENRLMSESDDSNPDEEDFVNPLTGGSIDPEPVDYRREYIS